MTLPGTRALAIASQWFDPRTVSTVFEPLVADWQRQWLDAAPPKRARTWRHGAAAFCVATITASPQVVATKVSNELRDGVMTWMFRVSAIAAAVLLIPVVHTGGPMWLTSARVLISLPTMAALTIPFSVIGAVDVIRRRGAAAPHVQRAVALKVAVASASLCC